MPFGARGLHSFARDLTARLMDRAASLRVLRAVMRYSCVNPLPKMLGPRRVFR
jgi:hypothetical protein